MIVKLTRTRVLAGLIVLGFTVLFLSSWKSRRTLETFDEPKESIFVSVASYRDQSCMNTIQNIFEQAEFPERVFVGICEQNTTDVQEACVPGKFTHHANVRRLTIPHTEAKGPTYARYLCSTLFRDETYFMQIDSHTVFVKDWDSKVIKELRETPNPDKAILTGYPHDSKANTLDEQSVPILCDSKFNNEGIPQFLASVKSAQQVKAAQGKHFVVPFTSGGFIFGPGKIVREVPFDPNLPHVFQGEEVLYSARLWTAGYDFYTARLNILFHKYGRKDEKRWHDDNPGWHAEQKGSLDRLKRLLKLETPHIDNDRYGLGKERTVEQYWAFAGLDPKTKTSNSKSKFC